MPPEPLAFACFVYSVLFTDINPRKVHVFYEKITLLKFLVTGLYMYSPVTHSLNYFPRKNFIICAYMSLVSCLVMNAHLKAFALLHQQVIVCCDTYQFYIFNIQHIVVITIFSKFRLHACTLPFLRTLLILYS